MAGTKTIHVKRAYEEPAAADGLRILVDRLWPRGLSKDALRIDFWARDLAPSTDLRKWFGHDPEKWPEFKQRYFHELEDHADQVAELREKIAAKPVTLVFSAKDERHNNAVALKEYLEKQP